MSRIVDAARNLPKDPGHALATFGDRVLQIHPTLETMDNNDAEFIINFVMKFSKKFGIYPVDVP